jgi:hypothetical protein
LILLGSNGRFAWERAWERRFIAGIGTTIYAAVTRQAAVLNAASAIATT